MWFIYTLIILLAAMLARCTPAIPRLPRINNPGRHVVAGLASRDEQGHVHIRREIRDLKNNYPDQWALYILGLREFYNDDQASPLSLYEIAGIHGRPYKVWQDAQGLPGKSGGYCPHNNIMFLGWHRPYLALFEQELYMHVRDVAWRAAPNLLGRFLAAAELFRVPYWDWAIDKPLPDFVLSSTIEVSGPDGQNLTVINPLYQYEFHPIMSGDFDAQWTSMNHTLRWPTSNLSNAESQPQSFSSYFESHKRMFHDEVANAFMKSTTMHDFSINHIEIVHGYVHYTIGGAPPSNPGGIGHMWPVEYSAFEPMFMLLHANVDRLWSMWQVVHPDLWMVPESIGLTGNFVLEDNQVVDGNTPLSPFWKSSDSFWTSNDVRDTTILGYAYPETQSWIYASNAIYQRAVNTTISQSYSASARAMLTADGSGVTGNAQHINIDNSFTDWTINLEAVSSTIPSSFLVHFSFVGDFSSDSVKDVGMWTVLMVNTTGNQPEAEKIKRTITPEKKLEGSVSLTANLLDYVAAGMLKSLEAQDVVPFLRDKLTWMVWSDGRIVSQKSLQGLTVEVVSNKVYIPENPDMQLVYNTDVVQHPEITANKGGNAQS